MEAGISVYEQRRRAGSGIMGGKQQQWVPGGISIGTGKEPGSSKVGAGDLTVRPVDCRGQGVAEGVRGTSGSIRGHQRARMRTKSEGEQQEGGHKGCQRISCHLPVSGRGRGHPAPSSVSECGARQRQRGFVGRAVGVRVEGRGLGSVRGAL